ncbi:alpha/beta fold hydrolase [Massilia sp. Leaf139]|uniref:alpha/beta fold hydrolase n=1 Tax=Massilia sp. Leaf139 TaxID=1736272 RepID=UPI0006FF2BC4|nr:alpha/beta hydrolase [Massilia sp. Leaf139]KQQ97047.1 alpha/beta hydrolase [Massilia sp. Leaf139]
MSEANINPRINSVQCSSPAGLHRIAYKEWGDPANPRVLVCVHGVTRVADDFDALARALCDTYRVVCPDVAGRGRSDRLRDPQLYALPQYVADMVTLIARVTANGDGSVHWFGTSMGGLIGMVLASLEGTPVKRLLLNDIGPALDGAALNRIADYIGQDLRFPDFESGARFVREVSASFGPHTDEQWHKLASDVLRQEANGEWVRHYDLALAQPFKAMGVERARQDEAVLWRAWDAIACPTLLVRGELSDLLSHETAQLMTTRGPKPRLVEIPGVGHAPTFVQPEQVAIAREFLTGA